MRKFALKSIAIGLLVIGMNSCDSNGSSVEASDTVTLTNQKDSLGYAYGVLIASDFFKRAIDIDPDAMASAMKVISEGKEGLISEEEARKFMDDFGKKLQQQEELKALEDAKINKETGKKFLADNGARAEVTTTASGLQYEVLKSGNGKTPTVQDGVSVHYTGTLMDGTVFDSSVERGQPERFGVTQVIKGWTEALLMMKEGDKWKVYIPSEIAYGDRGNKDIPAGSTLIFEMELLEVLTK